MSGKMSKRLVIDACVAKSAGETEHPVSKSCRETLVSVFKICHRVVMCKEIMTEWKKHQSRFSSSWLAAMQSRGKVIRIDLANDGVLADRLENAEIGTEKQLQAMLKDLHLVEAALQTDCRIISGDETVRALFNSAADKLTELKPIVWVNPVVEEDNCIRWLKEGAKYP